jgi:hypothetical protein
MWIRSQNGKSLINANEIWIPPYKTGNGIPVCGNHTTHEDSCTVLGTYPTESEALKVLDMLDSQIEALEYFKCAGKDRNMPCPPFAFQMPPVGFSKEENHE